MPCPHTGVSHQDRLRCWQLLLTHCLPDPGLPDKCFKINSSVHWGVRGEPVVSTLPPLPLGLALGEPSLGSPLPRVVCQGLVAEGVSGTVWNLAEQDAASVRGLTGVPALLSSLARPPTPGVFLGVCRPSESRGCGSVSVAPCCALLPVCLLVGTKHTRSQPSFSWEESQPPCYVLMCVFKTS